MSITLDEVRAMLLLCTKAFGGRRGRGGIIKFLLGEPSATTQQLANETGVAGLFGALSALSYPELLQSLGYLERRSFVEIVVKEAGGKSLPLLHLTPRGQAELDRLSPPAVGGQVKPGGPDRLLSVLTKIARLINGLQHVDMIDLVAHTGLSASQLDQYMQLLCKVLQLRAEAVLATPHARQHFAGTLERALGAAAFAGLSEVEAQALRSYVGLRPKHQLDPDGIRQYFDLGTIEDKARDAATRLASKEWQQRHPLVSLLGFLSL